MQQELLAVLAFQGVDDLLVLAGAQRGDHQGLGLAAGEERRAMGQRQDAHLADDLPDIDRGAAVDALAGVEDSAAHHVLLDRLQKLAGVAESLLVVAQSLDGGLLGGGHLGLAGQLLRLLIGLDQAGGDGGGETFLQGIQALDRGRQLEGLLGGQLGQLDDGLDDRLHLGMAEVDGAQHDLLGQLLGLGLDHQHAFEGAGDHQVEVALGHLGKRRVEHVVAVQIADPGAADGAEEGQAGDGEGRRSADHGDDVGIVLQVVGEHRADHLGLVAILGMEERTDRPVDEPRGQRLLLARPPLTLEKAAGDLARGEGLFPGS